MIVREVASKTSHHSNTSATYIHFSSSLLGIFSSENQSRSRTCWAIMQNIVVGHWRCQSVTETSKIASNRRAFCCIRPPASCVPQYRLIVLTTVWSALTVIGSVASIDETLKPFSRSLETLWDSTTE